MTTTELLEYATKEIARLGLGDTPTNCHGIVAQITTDDGVRLVDGVGLNVECYGVEKINAVLQQMADNMTE